MLWQAGRAFGYSIPSMVLRGQYAMPAMVLRDARYSRRVWYYQDALRSARASFTSLTGTHRLPPQYKSTPALGERSTKHCIADP